MAARKAAAAMASRSPPHLLRIVIEPFFDQLIAPPRLPCDLIQRSDDAFGIGEAESPARSDMVAFDQAWPDAHGPDLLEGCQHAALLGRELVASDHGVALVFMGSGVWRVVVEDRSDEIPVLQSFGESFDDITARHGAPHEQTDYWSVNTDRQSKSQLAVLVHFDYSRPMAKQ